MTPTDAVFAFAAWLTCREETLTVGAKHDAAQMAELADKWLKTNGLPDVSAEYPHNIKQPAS